MLFGIGVCVIIVQIHIQSLSEFSFATEIANKFYSSMGYTVAQLFLIIAHLNIP